MESDAGQQPGKHAGAEPPPAAAEGAAAYLRLLRIPAVRGIFILGTIIRIPMFAVGVALTLHVVTTLGGSYAQAGFVSTCATLGAAISGPWRGRLLDRLGLRRTIAPSIVVVLAIWLVAPWVGYWPLAVLSFVAGLFIVPTISIIRQVLLAATDERDRRAVLSLDSSVAELTFMAGPALGVWLATVWDTRWTILTLEVCAAAAAAVLWWVNPELRTGDGSGGEGSEPLPTRAWLRLPVMVLLGCAVATTIVLTGTDVGVVASLRSMDSSPAIGWCLAIWGLGSLIGGLGYGMLSRSIHVSWLLAALGATTIPVALAPNSVVLGALLFVTGLLCAPTLTAIVDQLTQAVPERARGEAMGWHGSTMTAGSAAGAPLAGLAIDHGGWQWGFVLVGAIGLLAALVALLGRVGVRRVRRRAAVLPGAAEAGDPADYAATDESVMAPPVREGP